MSDISLERTIDPVILDVFTKITAIVTHEMRNALAIINEGAGYLDDLSVMCGENGAVPADKVQRQAGSIAAQVARANRLMKDVNTYAHSGDTAVAEVSAAEMVNLMVALTRRRAQERSAVVEVRIGSGLRLTTKPLALLSALYFCLIGLYKAFEHEGQIIVEGHEAEKLLRITFTVSSTGEDLRAGIDDRIEILAHHLNARLTTDDKSVILEFDNTPHASSY